MQPPGLPPLNLNYPLLRPPHALLQTPHQQGKQGSDVRPYSDQFQGLTSIGSSLAPLPFVDSPRPMGVQAEAGTRIETQQALAQIPGWHWLGYLPGNQNRETAVLIPAGVDLSRPVEVVYYLHGHHGTVAKSLGDPHTGFAAEITAQDQAGHNRVWIIPQGPPKEKDYTWFHPQYQGSIQSFQSHAEARLQALAPGLQIGRITVMGHSAGGRAILNASSNGLKADRIDFLDGSYGYWASATWANQRRQNPALEMNVIYIPGTATAQDALRLKGQKGVHLLTSHVGHALVPKAFVSR